MGRQGKEQHQNAHAAHPLGLAAPEEDAGRHGLHRVQNGGAGGGQAGGRLEQCVHEGGNGVRQQIGERAQQRQRDPCQSHGGIAVPALHPHPGDRYQIGQSAQNAAQQCRNGECCPAAVAIPQTYQQRQQHEARFYPQDIAHCAGDQSNIHEIITSFIAKRQTITIIIAPERGNCQA